MSHEDIKAISDAYRSIYTDDSEIQLDEARKPNASALARKIDKMRNQDIDNLIEKIGDYEEAVQMDTGSSPIPSSAMKKVKKAASDLSDALRSVEDSIRRQ